MRKREVERAKQSERKSESRDRNNERKREEEGGEIKSLCCLCVILHYYQITLTEL